jgi:Tol biopolymer transport system component/tRNA A-37 threonylcarbamoyl transferase component Bud32
MPDLQSQLQQALADRYRIERELGEGGMATVYLAHDVKHDRAVALKVMRPQLAQSLGLERFLREIRISAQLNHPNILTLIDSGEAAGFTYYVLPYVAGESLRARLTREKQLPLDEALRIAQEVADALSYAHSLGVVHRDIKPENILFEAGHAVVTDFGIARAVSEASGERLTETGLAVGTPAYMSPEQAAGTGDVDARSDIYSLACVLYEMLAGGPPYSGPSAQAILARKTLEPVPGLRVVRETVPPVVEAAIMRALAKVPADRFATARQFAEALVGTRPVRVRGGRSILQNRVAAAAAVIVVVAAAGYLVLAFRGAGAAAGPIARSFTRLTRDPGVEWFPSLSPDGQWLLYSGEASGNRDIYLLSVGGQNPIDLTKDAPEDDDDPAFSPDGARIAFRSERDSGGIFVMGRTGEAVRRITRFGYRPSWSPDGTKLAFATENVDLNPQNSATHSQLWVADVTTGQTRQIQVTDATMPSWSPHGERIAFFERLGRPAGGHIWTIPAAGGEAVQATSGDTRDWSPVWSPDGRYLYYASDRGGSMNLWRVRINENSGKTLGDPQPITTPATSLAHPALSADGRYLVYSSVLVTTNIQKLGFDPVRGTVTGDPVWVTEGSRRWSDPDPSPDGQRVVFSSLTEPEGDLYLSRADGTDLRLLTGDSATDRVPRWSPDGRWIACFSDRSGPLQIWKIRPDGSDLTQLTYAPQNVAYAVWSPDSKRLVAASPTQKGAASELLYLFDPNRPWQEQEPQVEPPSPDSLAPFAPHSWSPDGERLAGMIAALDQGIVLYTFRTGTYARLTNYGQWPVWLPDSRRLLFVSGGNAFYVVDRVTRRVRKVFTVSRGVIGPPQLTRDGRTMYYSRRDTQADIWLVTLR